MTGVLLVLVVVTVVGIAYSHYVASTKAAHFVKRRPGPSSCAKDTESSFSNSCIALRKVVCADGLCCCAEHAPYAQIGEGALPLKFFVKGKGLRLSWDVCKDLLLKSVLENGKLVLEFRCGKYSQRPSGCREYPEQTVDGPSLCKYNEYLAPYNAYPFGHWIAYYGFPTDTMSLNRVFPEINPDTVLQILGRDPWKQTDDEGGKQYILIPVPKDREVLYVSSAHPPVTTLSQTITTWPQAMTQKYKAIYGILWRRVLSEDLKRTRGNRG